jgi:hypothetical protein
MQFIFKEDIGRDVKNWQRAVEAKSHGIDWKRFLPESISLDEVSDASFLRAYLKKEYYDSGKVSGFRVWLENNVHADEIRDDLMALMQKPFHSDLITVYLTTFHRAPYNPDESSLFLFEQFPRRERSVTTIYHELMHFLFHWYYWDQCRKAGLSESEIDALKESFTVLLNPILAKRNLPLDGGYPIHEAMRERWAILYKETPDFPIFLEKALSTYKDLQTS